MLVAVALSHTLPAEQHTGSMTYRPSTQGQGHQGKLRKELQPQSWQLQHQENARTEFIICQPVSAKSSREASKAVAVDCTSAGMVHETILCGTSSSALRPPRAQAYCFSFLPAVEFSSHRVAFSAFCGLDKPRVVDKTR